MLLPYGSSLVQSTFLPPPPLDTYKLQAKTPNIADALQHTKHRSTPGCYLSLHVVVYRSPQPFHSYTWRRLTLPLLIRPAQLGTSSARHLEMVTPGHPHDSPLGLLRRKVWLQRREKIRGYTSAARQIAQQGGGNGEGSIRQSSAGVHRLRILVVPRRLRFFSF